MTTRSNHEDLLIAGQRIFQASSLGWPTPVLTRYISPVPRSSCWKVAIFFESGDQSRIGLSL
jgi:hypothetical protein